MAPVPPQAPTQAPSLHKRLLRPHYPPNTAARAPFPPSAQVLGRANLVPFYNDGENGTGTARELHLEQRSRLALEGVVVAAVDVTRNPPGGGGARGRQTVGDDVSGRRGRRCFESSQAGHPPARVGECDLFDKTSIWSLQSALGEHR